MTLEDRVANVFSPFRRRLKKMNTGRFIPMQMRSEQVYVWVFAACSVTALISFGLYQLGKIDPLTYFLTHDIPLDVIVFVFAAFIAANHFWKKTPKAKLGYYPAYTLKNYEKDRKVELVMYEDKMHNKAVLPFEMIRCGGLSDLPFEGNGPVAIQPAIQDAVTQELNDQLRAGEVVDMPENARLKLSGGVWEGAEYNVPADFHLFLLGNTDDGLDDEFRRWIRQMYPDLTPLCVVMMAWDGIREKKVIGSIAPTLHPTGLHWHIADQERRIHYLEGLLKGRRKVDQKVSSIETTYAVLPEEEM